MMLRNVLLCVFKNRYVRNLFGIQLNILNNLNFKTEMTETQGIRMMRVRRKYVIGSQHRFKPYRADAVNPTIYIERLKECRLQLDIEEHQCVQAFRPLISIRSNFD